MTYRHRGPTWSELLQLSWRSVMNGAIFKFHVADKFTGWKQIISEIRDSMVI